MLTRLQWTIIGFLVGLPFISFAALMILTPNYMIQFFESSEYFDGKLLLAILSIENFVFLYFGLRSVNKHRSKQKTDALKGYPCREIATLMVSILLFTLPSLWIVFLYPSLVSVG